MNNYDFFGDFFGDIGEIINANNNDDVDVIYGNEISSRSDSDIIKKYTVKDLMDNTASMASTATEIANSVSSFMSKATLLEQSLKNKSFDGYSVLAMALTIAENNNEDVRKAVEIYRKITPYINDAVHLGNVILNPAESEKIGQTAVQRLEKITFSLVDEAKKAAWIAFLNLPVIATIKKEDDSNDNNENQETSNTNSSSTSGSSTELISLDINDFIEKTAEYFNTSFSDVIDGISSTDSYGYKRLIQLTNDYLINKYLKTEKKLLINERKSSIISGYSFLYCGIVNNYTFIIRDKEFTYYKDEVPYSFTLSEIPEFVAEKENTICCITSNKLTEYSFPSFSSKSYNIDLNNNSIKYFYYTVFGRTILTDKNIYKLEESKNNTLSLRSVFPLKEDETFDCVDIKDLSIYLVFHIGTGENIKSYFTRCVDSINGFEKSIEIKKSADGETIGKIDSIKKANDMIYFLSNGFIYKFREGIFFTEHDYIIKSKEEPEDDFIVDSSFDDYLFSGNKIYSYEISEEDNYCHLIKEEVNGIPFKKVLGLFPLNYNSIDYFFVIGSTSIFLYKENGSKEVKLNLDYEKNEEGMGKRTEWIKAGCYLGNSNILLITNKRFRIMPVSKIISHSVSFNNLTYEIKTATKDSDIYNSYFNDEDDGTGNFFSNTFEKTEEKDKIDFSSKDLSYSETTIKNIFSIKKIKDDFYFSGIVGYKKVGHSFSYINGIFKLLVSSSTTEEQLDNIVSNSYVAEDGKTYDEQYKEYETEEIKTYEISIIKVLDTETIKPLSFNIIFDESINKEDFYYSDLLDLYKNNENDKVYSLANDEDYKEIININVEYKDNYEYKLKVVETKNISTQKNDTSFSKIKSKIKNIENGETINLHKDEEMILVETDNSIYRISNDLAVSDSSVDKSPVISDVYEKIINKNFSNERIKVLSTTNNSFLIKQKKENSEYFDYSVLFPYNLNSVVQSNEYYNGFWTSGILSEKAGVASYFLSSKVLYDEENENGFVEDLKDIIKKDFVKFGENFENGFLSLVVNSTYEDMLSEGMISDDTDSIKSQIFLNIEKILELKIKTIINKRILLVFGDLDKADEFAEKVIELSKTEQDLVKDFYNVLYDEVEGMLKDVLEDYFEIDSEEEVEDFVKNNITSYITLLKEKFFGLYLDINAYREELILEKDKEGITYEIIQEDAEKIKAIDDLEENIEEIGENAAVEFYSKYRKIIKDINNTIPDEDYDLISDDFKINAINSILSCETSFSYTSEEKKEKAQEAINNIVDTVFIQEQYSAFFDKMEENKLTVKEDYDEFSEYITFENFEKYVSDFMKNYRLAIEENIKDVILSKAVNGYSMINYYALKDNLESSMEGSFKMKLNNKKNELIRWFSANKEATYKDLVSSKVLYFTTESRVDLSLIFQELLNKQTDKYAEYLNLVFDNVLKVITEEEN